jgi:signal transduction histidine kinase
MSRSRTTLLAWFLFAICVVGGAVTLVFAWWGRNVNQGGGWNGNGTFLQNLIYGLVVMSFPVVGVLLATRRPENAIGWILLAIGVANALPLSGYAQYAYLQHPLPLRLWVLAFDQWLWVPGIALVGTFTILLFPDGHLPSPRWRWLAWLSGFALVASSLAILVSPSPLQLTKHRSVANPLTIHRIAAILDPLTLVVVLIPVCMLLCAIALVVRLRRSRGVERQQIKWLAYAGALVMSVYFVVELTTGWYDIVRSGAQPPWLDTAQLSVVPMFGLIPIAIGIAIFRYRLYDIDVVINKTVVFGALAAFITVVYVAVVVGIGTLVGDPQNPALSIAATALVALAFGPVRARVRHVANRLVYGKRATPYEVMSGFTERVGAAVSVDQVLPQMAEAAARGVGASEARIRLRLPDGTERARSWPADANGDGAFQRSFDVRYQGEIVGAIDVRKPPSEPLRPQEDALLEDLAAQAGLALHNVLLTEELALRTDELAAQAEGLRRSRERLVSARDQQRKSLEREISEGPAGHLRSLRLELDEAERLAPIDPAAAAAILDGLGTGTTATLEELRDLARGIFPPLLIDKGVAPALEAHVRKVGVGATVEAAPGFADARFDDEVEACVYFCCLQALQNVARHAPGAHATVRLGEAGGVVTFEVRDDGPGFAVEQTPTGMGTDIMRDRIDALDGELQIDSRPGAGTTVTGHVPAHVLLAAG